MVLSTIIENGRTVRTWQEPRGNNQTLTRKFYLQYRVNAICNGKHYTIAICDTQTDAEKKMFETKQKVDAKYQPTGWGNNSSRTPFTHICEVGFLCTFGAKKSIGLYLTEEGANETISEVIE